MPGRDNLNGGRIMLVSKLKGFWKDEEGASLIEYVLLAALIGIAAIAGMRLVGGTANSKLTNVAGVMNNG